MRVNISVSDKINDYFEAKAKELGVSKSAMMCIALNEYIDQKECIIGLQQAMEQLEAMKNISQSVIGNNDKKN